MEDKLETCKNCAWWWPNRATMNKNLTLDPRYPHGAHWGCINPLLSMRIGTKDSPSGLSSYEEVETGPDFGCIHWQVKEPF